MEKEMICIICPKGCTIRVKASAEAAAAGPDISGHLCRRGAEYAVKEYTDPVRVLTTTVRLSGGMQPVAPVKSAGPLPKALLTDCMSVINASTAKAPLKVGDIIIKDILGTGTDIVSTSNISGRSQYGKTIYHSSGSGDYKLEGCRLRYRKGQDRIHKEQPADTALSQAGLGRA